MGAGRYDFTIEQGAQFLRIFTWQNQDGTAIDLSSYTARMQIKETKDSTTNLVSLTSSSGITLGGSAGTITVTIGVATTATLSFDTAVYDLEMIDGSGTVTRLLEGEVRLSREVTK